MNFNWKIWSTLILYHFALASYLKLLGINFKGTRKVIACTDLSYCFFWIFVAIDSYLHKQISPVLTRHIHTKSRFNEKRLLCVILHPNPTNITENLRYRIAKQWLDKSLWRNLRRDPLKSRDDRKRKSEKYLATSKTRLLGWQGCFYTTPK